MPLCSQGFLPPQGSPPPPSNCTSSLVYQLFFFFLAGPGHTLAPGASRGPGQTSGPGTFAPLVTSRCFEATQSIAGPPRGPHRACGRTARRSSKVQERGCGRRRFSDLSARVPTPLHSFLRRSQNTRPEPTQPVEERSSPEESGEEKSPLAKKSRPEPGGHCWEW